MLNLTFAETDRAIAERLQATISQSKLKLDNPVLMVLVTPEALADAAVQKAIAEAHKRDEHIAAFMLRPTPLPEGFSDFPPFDLTKTADPKAEEVVRYLNRVDMGLARVRRGQRLLFFVASAVILMFAAAIWGVGSGAVAFPRDEFATEFAFEQGQIGTFAAPTLEGVMPRTTEDAANFPMTVEAAPTRNRQFMVETATALPLGIASTEAARNTAIPLTEAALTAQASRTPMATATP